MSTSMLMAVLLVLLALAAGLFLLLLVKKRYRDLFDAVAEGQRIGAAEREEIWRHLQSVAEEMSRIRRHLDIEGMGRQVHDAADKGKLSAAAAKRLAAHIDSLQQENLRADSDG